MNRTFMFTSHFVKEWTRLGFTDDDQIRLEQMINENPQLGDVIIGAGGFRKIRFAFEDERQSQGLPIKGKAFFHALQKRLQNTYPNERRTHEPENTETQIREGKTSRKKSVH